MWMDAKPHQDTNIALGLGVGIVEAAILRFLQYHPHGSELELAMRSPLNNQDKMHKLVSITQALFWMTSRIPLRILS